MRTRRGGGDAGRGGGGGSAGYGAPGKRTLTGGVQMRTEPAAADAIQRKDEGDDREAEVLPPFLEPILLGILAADSEGDRVRASAQVNLLIAMLRNQSGPVRKLLQRRLSVPRADDALSLRFYTRLSPHGRLRVLGELRGICVEEEAEPKPAPEPEVTAEESVDDGADRAPGAGSADMWKTTIGEKSHPVGKVARVRAERGVRLRPQPIGSAHSDLILPFDTMVQVERKTDHDWCYVVAMDKQGGSVGFCEWQYLTFDPPEPTAHLHRVVAGENLGEIASRYYGKKFTGGNDARLYVQALYEANKNHDGVFLEKVDLDWGDTWHRKEDEEKTLEVYRGAMVCKGTAIWVPSEQFIQALKDSGAITSGSSELSKAWRAASEMVDELVEGLKYAAGFIVGILEGAFGAIVDLFQGAADLIEVMLKTLFHLITGNPGAIKDMVMGWVDKLKQAWANRDKIADWFMSQWEHPDGWKRGRFQGEVLGWVMMTVLIIILTAGEGAITQVAGKWASVIRVLKVVDGLGDVTAWAGKIGRLPGKAIDHVTDKVGKGGRKADDVLDEAGDAAKKADDVEAPKVGEIDRSPGQNAWETAAKKGDDVTPDSVRYGTVRMEDHPDFPKMKAEAEAKGFTIETGSPPRVSVERVVDETGKVIEVRKQLYVEPGMRYLDLEHEMGHLRQLDRFGPEPRATTVVMRKADGTEGKPHPSFLKDMLTTRQSDIVEYHNRLDEYVRLARRGAPKEVLEEHAKYLDGWRKAAETGGLGRGSWAKQHFPEIPELEKVVNGFGVKLEPKSPRW